MLVFIVFILILIVNLNKVREGEMVVIFANIGAGKTTYLARYAQKELKKIRKGKSKYKHVISNTPISGTIYVPNIRKLIETTAPEHTLILVDEAGIVWNNRKMKITDKEIEYLKLIRHYDSKMIAISQSYDDIDITIRRIYTSMFLLERFPYITLIKPIRKYVTIEPETEQIIDGYNFRSIFSWRFLLRPRYFKYFDTKWKLNDGRKHPDYKEFQTVPYRKKKLLNIRGIKNVVRIKKKVQTQ